MAKSQTTKATKTQSGTAPLVVAVSGGSDSVALLLWLLKQHPKRCIHVATVDHRLRPESAREAQSVAALAQSLGLAHATLRWDHAVDISTRADRQETADTMPGSTSDAALNKSAASARDARYNLLLEFARSIDASAIALGHTLNDQAETVTMRALRARADSNTRGLSGIPEWSTLRGMMLWRPLLQRSRAELREELKQSGQGWIDDPSNQNLAYERIRLRSMFEGGDRLLPNPEAVAKLAGLSSRTRQWLAVETAHFISSKVIYRVAGGSSCEATGEAKMTFEPPVDLPHPILLEVLASLILAMGGASYRCPSAKLIPLVQAVASRSSHQFTLGRCLIGLRKGRITIQRESRNVPILPKRLDCETVFDGRVLLQPDNAGVIVGAKPYINALESFRAAADDPIYKSLMNLLDSPSRST